MGKTNLLIAEWKAGASLIILGINAVDKDSKQIIKNLARNQLNMLWETRPNKNLPLEEQVNQDQKELIDYLTKVAETGEIE